MDPDNLEKLFLIIDQLDRFKQRMQLAVDRRLSEDASATAKRGVGSSEMMRMDEVARASASSTGLVAFGSRELQRAPTAAAVSRLATLTTLMSRGRSMAYMTSRSHLGARRRNTVGLEGGAGAAATASKSDLSSDDEEVLLRSVSRAAASRQPSMLLRSMSRTAKALERGLSRQHTHRTLAEEMQSSSSDSDSDLKRRIARTGSAREALLKHKVASGFSDPETLRGENDSESENELPPPPGRGVTFSAVEKKQEQSETFLRLRSRKPSVMFAASPPDIPSPEEPSAFRPRRADDLMSSPPSSPPEAQKLRHGKRRKSEAPPRRRRIEFADGAGVEFAKRGPGDRSSESSSESETIIARQARGRRRAMSLRGVERRGERSGSLLSSGGDGSSEEEEEEISKQMIEELGEEGVMHVAASSPDVLQQLFDRMTTYIKTDLNSLLDTLIDRMQQCNAKVQQTEKMLRHTIEKTEAQESELTTLSRELSELRSFKDLDRQKTRDLQKQAQKLEKMKAQLDELEAQTVSERSAHSRRESEETQELVRLRTMVAEKTAQLQEVQDLVEELSASISTHKVSSQAEEEEELSPSVEEGLAKRHDSSSRHPSVEAAMLRGTLPETAIGSPSGKPLSEELSGGAAPLVVSAAQRVSAVAVEALSLCDQDIGERLKELETELAKAMRLGLEAEEVRRELEGALQKRCAELKSQQDRLEQRGRELEELRTENERLLDEIKMVKEKSKAEVEEAKEKARKAEDDLKEREARLKEEGERHSLEQQKQIKEQQKKILKELNFKLEAAAFERDCAVAAGRELEDRLSEIRKLNEELTNTAAKTVEKLNEQLKASQLRVGLCNLRCYALRKSRESQLKAEKENSHRQLTAAVKKSVKEQKELQKIELLKVRKVISGVAEDVARLRDIQGGRELKSETEKNKFELSKFIKKEFEKAERRLKELQAKVEAEARVVAAANGFKANLQDEVATLRLKNSQQQSQLEVTTLELSRLQAMLSENKNGFAKVVRDLELREQLYEEREAESRGRELALQGRLELMENAALQRERELQSLLDQREDELRTKELALSNQQREVEKERLARSSSFKQLTELVASLTMKNESLLEEVLEDRKNRDITMEGLIELKKAVEVLSESLRRERERAQMEMAERQNDWILVARELHRAFSEVHQSFTETKQRLRKVQQTKEDSDLFIKSEKKTSELLKELSLLHAIVAQLSQGLTEKKEKSLGDPPCSRLSLTLKSVLSACCNSRPHRLAVPVSNDPFQVCKAPPSLRMSL